MSTQFITDSEGSKVAAVIPINEYDELMEDLEDLAVVVERKDEERIPLEEVRKQLAKDGLIPS